MLATSFLHWPTDMFSHWDWDQNGRHFTNDIFTNHFFKETLNFDLIIIKICSFQFNWELVSLLVQAMVWCQTGNKSSHEIMVIEASDAYMRHQATTCCRWHLPPSSMEASTLIYHHSNTVVLNGGVSQRWGLKSPLLISSIHHILEITRHRYYPSHFSPNYFQFNYMCFNLLRRFHKTYSFVCLHVKCFHTRVRVNN